MKAKCWHRCEAKYGGPCVSELNFIHVTVRQSGTIFGSFKFIITAQLTSSCVCNYRLEPLISEGLMIYIRVTRSRWTRQICFDRYKGATVEPAALVHHRTLTGLKICCEAKMTWSWRLCLGKVSAVGSNPNN